MVQSGFKKGVPRYYKKVLGIDKDDYKGTIDEKNKILIKELHERAGSLKIDLSYREYLKKYIPDITESEIRKFERDAVESGECIGDYCLSPGGLQLLDSMRKQTNINLRDKRLRRNKESL